MIKYLLLFICLSTFSLGAQKMNGVNYVSAKEALNNYTASLNRIEANYIALTPFMIMSSNTSTELEYEVKFNYWGDSRKNMLAVINEAHFSGKKIMLKPHIWVIGAGWAGNLSFSKKDWKKWENNFRKRMLDFAQFSEENNIESFCIGVELKSAVERNPNFFVQLINDIRKIYTGKLTYASNWDNYFNVPFWNKLDFIGIDGYFPISSKKNPSKHDLQQGWVKRVHRMKNFSSKVNKKIIFTEFGYRSTDYALGRQWEIEYNKNLSTNLELQQLGYQVFFEEVYSQSFVAGGFLWKWHADDKKMKAYLGNDYSPQHKPAEKIIKLWYLKM